jgi:hypothetical protein
MTGGISAEYGRFTGGVVSAIDKSGGNEFSGSFRDSLTNPSWDETSDFGEDQQDSVLTNSTKPPSAAASSAIVCGSSEPAARPSRRSRLFIDGGANPVGPVAREATVRRTTATKESSPARSRRSTPRRYVLDYKVNQTPHCAFGCWDQNTVDVNGRDLPVK